MDESLMIVLGAQGREANLSITESIFLSSCSMVEDVFFGRGIREGFVTGTFGGGFVEEEEEDEEDEGDTRLPKISYLPLETSS